MADIEELSFLDFHWRFRLKFCAKQFKWDLINLIEYLI